MATEEGWDLPVGTTMGVPSAGFGVLISATPGPGPGITGLGDLRTLPTHHKKRETS